MATEVRIRVWISESVSERLDAYIDAERTSVASTVDKALSEFLDRQEARRWSNEQIAQQVHESAAVSESLKDRS